MHFKAETTERAKSFDGIKLTLSPYQKLRSRRDFLKTLRSGSRFATPHLLICYRLGISPLPKLGITVSKKWGKAYKRNRFKRIIREAYRHMYPTLPNYLRINVQPRFSFETISLQEATRSLECLVKSLERSSERLTQGN